MLNTPSITSHKPKTNKTAENPFKIRHLQPIFKGRISFIKIGIIQVNLSEIKKLQKLPLAVAVCPQSHTLKSGIGDFIFRKRFWV
jgi:hypothetical protein